MVFAPGAAGAKSLSVVMTVIAGGGAVSGGGFLVHKYVLLSDAIVDAYILAKSTDVDSSSASSAEMYLPKPSKTQTSVAPIQSFTKLSTIRTASSFNTVTAAAEASEDVESDLSTDIKLRNYYCKFTEGQIIQNPQISNGCRVFDVPMDPTNKWNVLSKIQKLKDNQLVEHRTDSKEVSQLETVAKATKDKLKAKDNYFLIQVTKSTLASLKFTETAGIDLDIVPITATESNKKFASLKMVFVEWNKTLFQKSNYVLAQAGKLFPVPNVPPAPANPPLAKITIDQTTSPNTYACALKPGITNASELKQCTVHKFQTAPTPQPRLFYDTQFSGTLEKATDIDQDWWYLIEFVGENPIKDVLNSHLELMHQSNPPTTLTKTIQFKNMIPVAMADEDTNKKIPFILLF